MTARPRLWSAPFVLLTLSMFAAGSTFYLLLPTMAGYALETLGASQTQAGLASSAFFFGVIIGRVLAGRLLQNHGTRIILFGSLAGLLATCLIYLLPLNLIVVVVLRVAHGIAFGFAATALAQAAIGLTPLSRRAEATGWFGLGMALAAGPAPALALALVNSGAGQTAVFIANALCCVAALLLAGVVAGSVAKEPPVAPGARLKGLVARQAVPIGITVALCGFAYGSILAYLNVFAAERDLSGAANWYFVVFAIVLVVCRPVVGIAQDRLREELIAVPLIASVAIGVALTAVATHGIVLLLGAAFVGFGMGTLVSAGQAIAVNKVGQSRIGLGASSFFLLVDGATGFGPVVMGLLVDPLGYRSMLLVASVLPLIALAFYLLFARRVPNAPA